MIIVRPSRRVSKSTTILALCALLWGCAKLDTEHQARQRGTGIFLIGGLGLKPVPVNAVEQGVAPVGSVVMDGQGRASGSEVTEETAAGAALSGDLLGEVFKSQSEALEIAKSTEEKSKKIAEAERRVVAASLAAQEAESFITNITARFPTKSEEKAVLEAKNARIETEKLYITVKKAAEEASAEAAEAAAEASSATRLPNTRVDQSKLEEFHTMLREGYLPVNFWDATSPPVRVRVLMFSVPQAATLVISGAPTTFVTTTDLYMLPDDIRNSTLEHAGYAPCRVADAIVPGLQQPDGGEALTVRCTLAALAAPATKAMPKGGR